MYNNHYGSYYGDFRSGGRGESYRNGRGGGRDNGRGRDWEKGRGGGQAGRGGGGGRGGRGGGRGPSRGGKFWSEQRSMLENQGLNIQTNCYQLVPIQGTPCNHDNASIYQYTVSIDALVKKKNYHKDSTYDPLAEKHASHGTDLPDGKVASYLVKKTFHSEVITADDNQSTSLSRRILNNCQRKLQEITPHQSFVRFFVYLLVFIYFILLFLIVPHFHTRFMMVQTSRILGIG